MKLGVKAMAITWSLLVGFGIFFLTWWVIFFEGTKWYKKSFIGRVYRGYRLTPKGSVLGLLWGLADGFFGGAVFAWLYNKLESVFPAKNSDY
ncbi:hypothetical protein CHISP_3153 [Chitinispirillum alkaliphilum]|nr:hypothetical protein CHISP_3153 [Chitinispirillum alkaliphilum]